MSSVKQILILLIFAIVQGGLPAQSQAQTTASPSTQLVSQDAFPWMSVQSSDFEMIRDALIEQEVRLHLIASARERIRYVTYAQMSDNEINGPMLSAMREAANRGVNIQFLTNYVQGTVVDLAHRIPRYLLGVPTRAPIQLLMFGGPQTPFGLANYIHEKLLIIDDEIVMTTGRPVGANNITWQDKAVMVRGPLVAPLVRAYNRVWRFANTQNRVRVSAPVVLDANGQPPAFRRIPSPIASRLDRGQQAEVQRLNRWTDERTPRPFIDPTPTSMTGVSLTGPRARVLHNGFLQQLWQRGFPSGVQQRVNVLQDPIMDALIERLQDPNVREVIIATMAVVQHPSLKQALMEVARRRNPDGTPKARVTFYTNSRDARSISFAIPFNFDFSIYDMQEMIRAGIHVAGFFPAAPDGRSRMGREDYPWLRGMNQAWTYLHEKIALVDDTVFFGSHNFNLPSSVYNDEVSVELVDPHWARRVRDGLWEEMRLHSVPIWEEDVTRFLHDARFYLPITRGIGSILLPLF